MLDTMGELNSTIFEANLSTARFCRKSINEQKTMRIRILKLYKYKQNDHLERAGGKNPLNYIYFSQVSSLDIHKMTLFQLDFGKTWQDARYDGRVEFHNF